MVRIFNFKHRLIDQDTCSWKHKKVMEFASGPQNSHGIFLEFGIVMEFRKLLD